MAKLKKGSRFHKRTKRYYSKMLNWNRNAFGERYSKRVTSLASLSINNAGNAYLIDNTAALNLNFELAGTEFFLSSMFNNLGAPNWQRYRVSGITLEYMSSNVDLTAVGALVSLPSLALSIFPDYIDVPDIASAQSIYDQKDRFVVLPFNTTRQQRKYWSFPKTVISSGRLMRPQLGSYIDLLDAWANRNAANFPGLLGCTAIGNFLGANNLGVPLGTFAISYYLELDKANR